MTKEWKIDAPSELIEELAQSFKFGPMIDDSGIRMLNEELVAHLHGLKIEIFSNEHPPPHFRVKYAGETANYVICDCSQMNGGLKKWKKNINKWHQKNKFRLIQTWDETRPSDCTVGEYRFNEEELADASQILEKPEADCGIDLMFLRSKVDGHTNES